jgi:hypothetical protein
VQYVSEAQRELLYHLNWPRKNAIVVQAGRTSIDGRELTTYTIKDARGLLHEFISNAWVVEWADNVWRPWAEKKRGAKHEDNINPWESYDHSGDPITQSDLDGFWIFAMAEQYTGYDQDGLPIDGKRQITFYV